MNRKYGGLPGTYIPGEVQYNPELSWGEGVLFGIILNLDKEEGCWATNEYFGKHLKGITPQSVSRMLAKLQKLGYIKMEYNNVREQGHTVTKRRIYVDWEYQMRYKHLISYDSELTENTSGLNKNVKASGLNKNVKQYNIKSNILNNIPKGISSNTLPKKKEKEGGLISYEEDYPILPKNGNSNKNINSPIVNKERTSYDIIDTIVQQYSILAPSLPKILKVTPARRKSIGARLRDYSEDEIYDVFVKAEESDFLSGRNEAWKGCNIDWLMNPNNFIKVLEGKYVNTGSSKTNKSIPKISVKDYVNQNIKDPILRKSFLNTCFEPAVDMLDLKMEEEIKLAQELIQLKEDIENEQDKNITKSQRGLFPGSLALIRGYLEFLNDSNWITNLTISIFSIKHNLFQRYRREQAKEDNLERDALTGRSYMRE